LTSQRLRSFTNRSHPSLIRHKAETGTLVRGFILSILSLIALSAFPSALHAEEIELGSLYDGELTVRFEKPLERAAEEVAAIYPDIKAGLEKTLGWKLSFRPTVLLIRNGGTFRKMAGNRLFVAFAVPGRNLVVIDYSRMKTRPFTLEITLRHELSHLMLHYHIRNGLPRWIDEGVSQWVSGGIAEIIMDTKRSPLKDATLSGKFIPLNDLTRSFPAEKNALLLAYEESKSIMEYIDGKYGREAVIGILNRLREGATVQDALNETLGRPMEEVESEWHEELRRKTTWITFLSNNLYEILFFLAALITIAGFIRLLLRKRAYTDDEEEEEEC